MYQHVISKIKIFIFINVAVFAMASTGFCQDYIVSPDISYGNGTGTLDSPYSLRKANEVAIAGDTIYLRVGTYGSEYKDHVCPENDGSEGKYITYMPYNNESVTIQSTYGSDSHGVDITGKSYIKVDGLIFDGCTGSGVWTGSRTESGTGADYCIIQNCSFKNIDDAYTVIYIGNGSSYNKVLNNVIDGGMFNGNSMDGITIGGNRDDETLGAQYNLVEGNEIYSVGHSCCNISGSKTHHNIVRNNFFHSARKRVDSIGDVPNLMATGALTYRNVIENNRLYYPYSNSLQFRCKDHIVRRNIFYKSNEEVSGSGDAAAILFSATSSRPDTINNKIYNNTTYYRQTSGGASWFGIKMSLYDSSANLDNNVIKNNIIFGADVDSSSEYPIYFSRSVSRSITDSFDSNVISKKSLNYDGIRYFLGGRGNTYYTLSEAKADPEFAGVFLASNMETDPMLEAPENLDFRLKADSPLIDAGTNLTKVISDSGNARSFKVEDAGYFLDGWGIVDGDSIRIGNSTGTIESIDYDTNMITLSKEISWEKGETVNLTYNGSGPDIGAFEFGLESSNDLLPPQDLQVVLE